MRRTLTRSPLSAPSRRDDPQVTAKEPGSKSRPRALRIIVIAAVVTVILLIAALAVPLAVSSTPQFFSRYHLLNRRFVNLENSAHEGIACRQCHQTQPVGNGISLVGDFYRSFVTTDTDSTLRFFKFAPPTREACLKCHEDDWSDDAARTKRIPHPAHLRVASENRNCVDCHKWTAHFEKFMEKHKKMPFSGVCVSYGCHVGTKKKDQCFNCHHVLHESGDQWKTEHASVVATTGESACLETCHKVEQCQQCHTTGVKPKFNGLPIEVGMKAIEALHVKPDWTSRYHGAEAIKDKAKCLLCHQSVGECDECHLQRPAFHGATETWIGRHSKQAKAVDDPRCLACHKKPWCEECHQKFKEME
jgi:hypothetical protein